jgi:hypothetical protein
MRDMLHNKQVVDLGTLTLSGTTPATSAYVDLKGYDACTIIVRNNTITDAGTAAGFTVTLQESADTTGAGAGTVATTDTPNGTNTVTVTSDTADDSVAGGMGYIGDDRYVGVSAVGTTGTDADITILAVLNKPHKAKTTLVGTKVART